MNILQNKWISFACSCLNGFFAVQCYITENWVMFGICSGFALICGYNFWKQTGEE
jgi:hypothetical protein